MSFPALTASTTILPVPVIGHRGDDAVDVLVVEQLLVATRHRQSARTISRASVWRPSYRSHAAAHSTPGSGSSAEQPGSLHPDADDPESHAVARGHLTSGFAERLRFEWDSVHGEGGADGAGAGLKELTAGRADVHGPSLTIDSRILHVAGVSQASSRSPLTSGIDRGCRFGRLSRFVVSWGALADRQCKE